LEIPAPIPKVYKVEEEIIELVLKPGIPNENGGLVALCVNEAVITAINGIGPLLKLEEVKTIVVRIDDGWIGGGTPPIVTVVKGI
jgi:hypothetical protein